MKIFSVARNYGPLSERSPFGEGESPMWYEVPDSALLRSGQPFFVPDFAGEFRAMPTVIYRISRLGKGISERFAHRYIDAVAMGCAVVGADLLRALRVEGAPWCRAVAFDKACMLGEFRPWNPEEEPRKYTVTCGDGQLEYSTSQLRREIGELLEDLSRDNTLKNGDLVLAALHPTGLPLNVGDKLIINDNNNDSERYALMINIK